MFKCEVCERECPEKELEHYPNEHGKLMCPACIEAYVDALEDGTW